MEESIFVRRAAERLLFVYLQEVQNSEELPVKERLWNALLNCGRNSVGCSGACCLWSSLLESADSHQELFSNEQCVRLAEEANRSSSVCDAYWKVVAITLSKCPMLADEFLESGTNEAGLLAVSRHLLIHKRYCTHSLFLFYV